MTIYLYHKHCSHCGLKYFGRTSKSDPYKYMGSGKKWKSHIKAHGLEYVITDWVLSFNKEEECTNYALMFSNQYDIVESSEYANLCIEDGLHASGTVGYVVSTETRRYKIIREDGTWTWGYRPL